ncbi:hypothetical protein HLV38_05025 [Berryella wangjianweii]|uniref:Type I restriction modification DNA specificity domain-containing protein n=1 Tax=Berryella wangjianweii TaxID=2734634 RepID=A0A6M8J0Q1_9ACTN|nr:restriction endonuclease subunit S [Berryella wangjianweii]QKF07550.1 hypothetical protein HLV38_05025 [Berryella wangjianweii]
MVKQVSLADACILIMGQSPSSDSYNKEHKGLPFFQGNADFGKVSPIAKTWCTNPKKVAEKGDILLSVRAPIGAVNLASEQCCIGRGLAAVRPKSDGIRRNYLKHLLLACRPKLEHLGTGSTFKAIGKKSLSEFSVPLYRIEEQKQIEQRFELIFECVSIQNEVLVRLDELVKSRFIEMFGDPANNPKEYKVSPLGDCLSIQPSNGMYKPLKEYVVNGSGTPIVRIDSFEKRWPGTACLKRLNCTDSDLKRYGLRRGDIVINRVNSIGHMGKSMMVGELNEDVVFESNMMRLHANEALMIPAFMAAQLDTRYSKGYFESNAKRAIGQASINQTDVKRLSVLVPPIELQEEYVAFVAQVDKLEFAARQQIEKLQTLYDSLAQSYFGGQED